MQLSYINLTNYLMTSLPMSYLHLPFPSHSHIWWCWLLTLIPRVRPIIYERMFLCHVPKLFSIISLGIPLCVFTSNLTIVTTYSCVPLLVTWPQNANCLFLEPPTSSIYSWLHLTHLHYTFNIILRFCHVSIIHSSPAST